MALNPTTGVLRRDRRRQDTETREGHVKTQANIGFTQPQAKDSPKPPEAGRGKEVPSPRALGGDMGCPYLDVGFLAHGTTRD